MNPYRNPSYARRRMQRLMAEEHQRALASLQRAQLLALAAHLQSMQALLLGHPCASPVDPTDTALEATVVDGGQLAALRKQLH